MLCIIAFVVTFGPIPLYEQSTFENHMKHIMQIEFAIQKKKEQITYSILSNITI